MNRRLARKYNPDKDLFWFKKLSWAKNLCLHFRDSFGLDNDQTDSSRTFRPIIRGRHGEICDVCQESAPRPYEPSDDLPDPVVFEPVVRRERLFSEKRKKRTQQSESSRSYFQTRTSLSVLTRSRFKRLRPNYKQ